MRREIRQFPSRWWLLACGLAAASSCDPVHNHALDALGPETPGVAKGPLHRPGQPCGLCHDGALGDPPAFSVAGTVFENAGDRVAFSGATITLTDASGRTYAATTNAAGNFYLTPQDFLPRYPMHVAVTSSATAFTAAVTVKMQSHIGSNGSCAGCHADPPGPDSPGHVYFNQPDGGTP